MPNVKHNVVVPYTAEQMYDLVNDIPKYPEFIPLCVGAKILDTQADGLTASMTFSGHGFTKSVTTQNRIVKNKEISIRLVEGPFQQLEGSWHFQDIEKDSCKILLDLNYEFSNRLFAMMIGPMFQTAADTLIAAFKSRADEVYGRRIES